ncbi:MAG: hypothetical protein ABIG90_02410 [bacterium]
MDKIDYKSLEDKISTRPDKYLKLGQDKGYFVLDGKKIKDKIGKKTKANQKTEILFIERCIDFLKPKTGKMAIVLPDGILTNSSLQPVRDHMNDLELIFTMLGERATTEIHRTENSIGLPKLKADSKAGGNIAGGARKKLEKRLGKPISSKENYLQEPEAIKRIK